MTHLSFHDITPILHNLRLGWQGSDLDSPLTQLSVEPASISLQQTILVKSLAILLQSPGSLHLSLKFHFQPVYGNFTGLRTGNAQMMPKK